MLLLENVMLSKKRGSHMELVVPADGAVLIPGQIALLPHAKRSIAARHVYDAILSDDVQKVIVELGVLHSPDPLMPPPDGTPTLDELLAAQPKIELKASPEEVKTTFAEIFFK